MLEEKTVRVEVDGVQRYATPLLWKEDAPPLHSPKEAVLGHLCWTEKRLSKEPARADTEPTTTRSRNCWIVGSGSMLPQETIPLMTSPGG